MKKNEINSESEKKLVAELALVKKSLKKEIALRKKAEKKSKVKESNSKKSQKEKQRQDDFFRSIIQSSSDIVFLLDKSGTIQYVSHSITEILGFAENELLTKQILELIHSEDALLMQVELEKISLHEGKHPKIEMRFLRKEGGFIALEAEGNNQFANSSIKGFLLAARVAVKSGKAIEDLKNSEEQKDALLSSITDAFIALDKDWNLTYINRRANVMFNRANKKLIGKSFWDSFTDNDEHNQKYLNALSKTKHTEFECFCMRVQKWLNVKIFPSKTGVSVFYNDITEIKIQRTILELEQFSLIENNKRTKKLNEIIDKAILKMESIIPGMYCSVLLLSENGNTLTNFSGPSLSTNYQCAINEIEISMASHKGSSAIFSDTTTIVSNIQKEANWSGFQDVTKKEGFISCWSFPVSSSEGNLLALFVVYFKKEIVPSKVDSAFITKIVGILSNLIERRKKDDEITKLSLIAKNTNKAVFIADLNQQITWINPAFTVMTGYQFEEVLGKNPFDVLQGEKSDPDIINYLHQQMVGNNSFTLNTIFHKKNKDVYWSRITGQPMFDETGAINQYFAIQEDTTARKLSKINLQDSEKRYRAIFHSNAQPMYIYDKASLKFIEVNESAVNTYGYSTEEFNEMRTIDLLDDIEKAAYDPSKEKINYRSNILNKKETLIEICVNKTKKGNFINVEVIRNEMVISGKPSILVIVNDVTKKMITEQNLIQSNERFSLASKAVNEAIWDLDLSTNKLFWADGISVLFGYEEQNELPTRDNWEAHLHPDDYKAVKLIFDSTLANKKVDYWNSEYRFLKKDGTYAYVLDNAYIVRNTKGKPLRVIGAMQDITRQKNFEIQQLTLISETQDHERKRFSMELHDGLAQHLVALNLYLSQIAEEEMVDHNALDSCFAVLKTSLNQTRALCYSLTPPELDHGFLLALQAMFERLKAVKAFNVSLLISLEIGDVDFQSFDKYNLYRIIQEFINNSIKHSGGSLISCKVTKTKNVIYIDTNDNGKGFDITKKNNSLGLKNIEQRAFLAKIKYTLKSTLKKGTHMQIELKQ